jgi:hypothetical protein
MHAPGIIAPARRGTVDTAQLDRNILAKERASEKKEAQEMVSRISQRHLPKRAPAA